MLALYAADSCRQPDTGALLLQLHMRSDRANLRPSKSLSLGKVQMLLRAEQPWELCTASDV